MSGGRSKFARMTRDDRLLVMELLASGSSAEEAGRAVGCTGRSVHRLLVALGGVKARQRPRSLLRLSLEDREEIRVGLGVGDSFAQIARSIGRSASTVSREVANNGGRRRYRAAAADRAACRRAGPSPPSWRRSLRCEAVSRNCWCSTGRRSRSPAWLARVPRRSGDAGVARDDLSVAVRAGPWRAAQGAGSAVCGRGRTRRRPHRPPAMAGARSWTWCMISERPAEVEDRAVPGHWEGD